MTPTEAVAVTLVAAVVGIAVLLGAVWVLARLTIGGV